jgi:hypothetical protein
VGKRRNLLVYASVVSLLILALLLSNPFVFAVVGTTTMTHTSTRPITTVISTIPATTIFTTETQAYTSSMTYTLTSNYSITETEKTTFLTSSTTTMTSTVTSPTATITMGTTQTLTTTSRRIYTATITTLLTRTATTNTSMTTWTWTTTKTYSYGLVPVTVIISCNHPSVVVGERVTCTALVFGTDSPPGLQVQWYGNSSSLFSSKLSSKCALGHAPQASYSACSVNVTPKAAGFVILTAAYSGDLKYSETNGTAGLNVTPKDTKTIPSCKPTFAVSSTSITCNVTVTGYKPTGNVTWSQSGTGSVAPSSTACTLKTGKPANTGTCSVTMTATKAGKVILQASYSGDSNNQGSSRKVTLNIG